MVGFPFKAYRFINLHTPAIQFPASRLNYFGLKANDDETFSLDVCDKFEIFPEPVCNTSVKGWESDCNAYACDTSIVEFNHAPYGCSQSLLDKRSSRNPYRQVSHYEKSCPELRDFLNC